MSAEVLRRAARAIRDDAPALDNDSAWHPAVALAVADWLAEVAGFEDGRGIKSADTPAALAVATAYLAHP